MLTAVSGEISRERSWSPAHEPYPGTASTLGVNQLSSWRTRSPAMKRMQFAMANAMTRRQWRWAVTIATAFATAKGPRKGSRKRARERDRHSQVPPATAFASPGSARACHRTSQWHSAMAFAIANCCDGDRAGEGPSRSRALHREREGLRRWDRDGSQSHFAVAFRDPIGDSDCNGTHAMAGVRWGRRKYRCISNCCCRILERFHLTAVPPLPLQKSYNGNRRDLHEAQPHASRI